MTERIERGRWDDEEEEAVPAPLTREQVLLLRAQQPSVSVWQVVAAQAAAGLVVVALCLVAGGSLGWSALYGAASVVVPSALMARGITKLSGAGPAAAAVGLMFWEGVKVLLTLVMLLLAVRVVPHLSWPALLSTLVVCLSMNWLALLWRGRPKNNELSR